MARRERDIFKGLDSISFQTPTRRELRMSRNDYQVFGALYYDYRYQRKTWLNEFTWPFGEFQKPERSRFIEEAEAFADKLRTAETPDEFQPMIEAMARLAPALLDERNNWQRFREEMEMIREAFEADGPTHHQYKDDEPGRHRILGRLHEIQKAIPVRSAIHKNLRAVLFWFARAVAGRRNWKRPLNKWEHGVTKARQFEFDDIHWSKSDCLRHARYQLILLGRLPTIGTNNGSFNRTRIRNRAAILYEIAHLPGKDSSFRALIERIKDSRKNGDWEAYMNKLSKRAFPKKTVRTS